MRSAHWLTFQEIDAGCKHTEAARSGFIWQDLIPHRTAHQFLFLDFCSKLCYSVMHSAYILLKLHSSAFVLKTE